MAETCETTTTTNGRITRVRIWLPWVILAVFVFTWGVSQLKAFTDGPWAFKFAIPGLDKTVFKDPPVVPEVIVEGAVLSFSVLPVAGMDILVSAAVDGLLMSYPLLRMLEEY